MARQHSKSKRLRRSKRQNRSRQNVRSALPGRIGNVNPMASYICTTTFDIKTSGSVILDPTIGIPDKLTIYAMPPRDTDANVKSNRLTVVSIKPHASAFVGPNLVETILGEYDVVLPFNGRLKKLATLNFKTWFKNGLQLKAAVDPDKKKWYDVAFADIYYDDGVHDRNIIPISLYLVYKFETPLQFNSPTGMLEESSTPVPVQRGVVTDVNVAKASVQGKNTIGVRVRQTANAIMALPDQQPE